MILELHMQIKQMNILTRKGWPVPVKFHSEKNQIQYITKIYIKNDSIYKVRNYGHT